MTAASPIAGAGADRRRDQLTVLACLLGALVAVNSLVGWLMQGGPGRQAVQTARGATVTLYGEGLYSADSWLIGAGNRGQDLAMLIFELPVLVLIVWWYRKGSAVAAATLAGVLGFFTYYYVSTVFGTAQNKLFPLYVAALSLAAFMLMIVASGLKVDDIAASLPLRPGRPALAIYLLAVAAALTFAWLPGMIMTAVSGEIAEAVGPYTSAATEALDLGFVVPVAVIAAVQLLRRRNLGHVLALVMLVVNVCIGVVLMAQGVAQLVLGVPLSVEEIVGKMLTFAALTLVAGGLLVRMARRGTSDPTQQTLTLPVQKGGTPR